MNGAEFRRQVFKTREQWTRGIGVRLAPLDTGGFALFSRLGFSTWVSQSAAARCAGSLTTGACGRMFWAHRHDGGVYRLDPAAHLIERVAELAEPDDARGRVLRRILWVDGRLWVLDRSGAAIAMRPDTFQIIAELDLDDPADLTSGGGWLFSLNRNGVSAYDSTGRPTAGLRREPIPHPVTLGASPRGDAVFVVDSGLRAFLRFSRDGRFEGELGSFDEAGPTFTPRVIAVHPGGSLFVSDGTNTVHEFGADGGYIGATGTLGSIPAITDMAFDANGALHVATPAGIACLTRAAGMAGNDGVFYSGTLDNGSDNAGTWHRLDLVVDIAGGGAVDVFYASSTKPALAELVEGILARGATPVDAAAAIDGVLQDLWRGPQLLRPPAEAPDRGGIVAGRFAEPPTHSVLFDAGTGRYLWLKVVLSGLSPAAAASMRELRVVYPRLSYLRYLPAVYQEDKPSREFLERYLSMFETVLSDLEMDVTRVHDLFDPNRTPPAFLDWLAQWLDLGFEEEWSAAVKRQVLLRAPQLYETKGTPGGLAELIEIVTGRPAVIRESFEADRPSILGGSLSLGIETYLRSPASAERPRSERLRLGDAHLGQSALLKDSPRTENPFSAAANRFTVALDLSWRQFRRYERSLHRIIREHAPAHADYEIRLISDAGLGAEALVGINLRVQDPQPLHLGHSALGRAICRRSVRYGPELGIDAIVTGPHHDTEGARALHGER